MYATTHSLVENIQITCLPMNLHPRFASAILNYFCIQDLIVIAVAAAAAVGIVVMPTQNRFNDFIGVLE